MKLAITSLIVLVIGAYSLLRVPDRSFTPVAPDYTPDAPDYASTFRSMEATKAQAQRDRAFIETYRAWAPTEAAWALRLLNDVDAGILLIEEQALCHEGSDLAGLQERIDRYHAAAEEFRAAAKNK